MDDEAGGLGGAELDRCGPGEARPGDGRRVPPLGEPGGRIDGGDGRGADDGIDPSLVRTSSGQAMLTGPVAAPLGTTTASLVAVAVVTDPAMVDPLSEVKDTVGRVRPHHT